MDFDDDILDDDLKAEANGDDEDSNIEELLQQVQDSASEKAQLVSSGIRSTEWIGLTRATLYGIALLPLILLTPIIRVIPMSWKLYHKLHIWSAWQIQRAANADALANVRHPNDKEDVLPAAYVEGDEQGTERTGWKIKGLGDKRYDPSVHGGSTSRMGKADLIHVNEDDLEQGTWTEATIDSAFQLDRERYLFRDASVNVVEQTVATDPSLNGGDGAAVADGGVDVDGDGGIEYQTVGYDVSIRQPGVLEDVLVPLQSRTGYDGQLVSWDQYSNLKEEQADQETVRDAKNAGWMAAKLDDIDGTDLIKWAIILGIAGAVLLFNQDIGAAISGIAGGGGSGNVAPSAGLGLIPLIKTRLGGD